jgi:hypothetical protein
LKRDKAAALSNLEDAFKKRWELEEEYLKSQKKGGD